MNRPLPWWQPEVGERELALVTSVLASQYLNEGEVTERFERALAERLGAKHAIATTSGTAALFLALRGLGLGPGDEVLVPDVTFIATANAVHLAGATPVLVDVDPETLVVTADLLEQAIGPRTRAMIPVHVSGRGAPMRAIASMARARGLLVVEDAAEALGSKHDGKFLGTWGHAGCFSFSPHKTITTGQGGLVVTDDDALAAAVRQLKDQGRPTRGTGGDDAHPTVGYNFKLTNVQAAIGLGQLERLDARLARLREIFVEYRAELARVDGIVLPGFDVEHGEVPQWVDALSERRDALDAFLSSRGAHCRRFWHPLHTQPPYRLADGRFPGSSKVCSRAIWLPSAFQLSRADIERVSSLIADFTRGAS